MKPVVSQLLWAGPAVCLGGSYHLGLFVLKLSFKTRNTGTGANRGFYTFKNNNNRGSDWKHPPEFAKVLQRGRRSRSILMLPSSAGPGLEVAAGRIAPLSHRPGRAEGGQPFPCANCGAQPKKPWEEAKQVRPCAPRMSRREALDIQVWSSCFFSGCWKFGFSTAANPLP